MENQIQNQTEFKWQRPEDMSIQDLFITQDLIDLIRDIYKNTTVNHPLPELPEFMSPVADYYKECLAKFRDGEWRPLPYLADAPIDVLIRTLPHVSIKNPSLVAYWQNEDKLSRHVESVAKPSKFYASFVDGDAPSTTLDGIARSHRLLLQPADVRVMFAANDDLQMWRDVYRSYNIKSCMNNSEYGVTKGDTYKCYTTAAHGLPDNGLRLAWLPYRDAFDAPYQAVSRAIVHEPTKTYVRVYGDEELKSLLDELGYRQAFRYPEGLILYTEHLEADEAEDISDSYLEGYLASYVDGELCRADLDKINGVDCFRLCPEGLYELQDPEGVVRFAERCPSCGEMHTDLGYELLVDGEFQMCCESCYNDGHRVRYCGRVVDLGLDEPEPIYVMLADGSMSDDGYYDSSENFDYYEIAWSEYHKEYVFIDDAEVIGNDYVLPEVADVVYLDYSDSYEWSHEVTYIDVVDAYVLDADLEDWEFLGEVYSLPVEGLCDEFDTLVSEFKAGLEAELEAELEEEVAA